MAAQPVPPQLTPEQLYEAALEHVARSEPGEALATAKQLWSQVRHGSIAEALPALNLLGEISIELGAVESAREYFEQAVRLDPEGRIPEAHGGGAEKFLWLAQLCEEGGRQSVAWYEKGAKALQREIADLEAGQTSALDKEQLLLMRLEKKRKLATALCGVVEVYMTDLSWEDDAEARCESFVTEAIAVEDDPSPEVLQTLASVRLSQQRKQDAQAALKRSLDSWMELEPEDPSVPDFATKISLARLLMEAEMEDEAMEVLHRLIQEDDQSVEANYLAGWCQYLLAGRNNATVGSSDDSAMPIDAEPSTHSTVADDRGDVATDAMKRSRRWMKTALKLYQQQDYEDDRLFHHAEEIVKDLDMVLGPDDGQTEEIDQEEEEWDGIEDEDEDEEMEDP